MAQRPPLTGVVCECATCGERFQTPTAFDKHRVGPHDHRRRCLTLTELASQGFTLDKHGNWKTPVSDQERERRAKLKRAPVAAPR